MTKSSTYSEYVIFPITLSVGLFITYYFSSLGNNPMSIAIIVSLSAMLVVGLLERAFPYRSEWNRNNNDIKTDFWHTLINQILLSRSLTVIWTLLLASSTAWLASTYGSNLWPHHWPVFLQLPLMLLIAEFGRYWLHRFSHRNPWLWRLHAVHHSPTRLYFFNAGRVHPLEKVIYIIPEAVPFIILGTNIECLALYATFNSIHGFFQHGNVKVKLGPLNYFFSMSELHRWHHSKIVEESDHNFGNNLSVWDVVFGTWFLPKEREVGPLGLLNDSYPEGYMAQVKAPFQRLDLSKPQAIDLNNSERAS